MRFQAKPEHLKVPKKERYVNSNGYTVILVNGKYIGEHRIIVEQEIGRKLKKSEVVHHWNCDRSDNRVENLGLFRHHRAHLSLHDYAKKNGIDIKELWFDSLALYRQ